MTLKAMLSTGLILSVAVLAGVSRAQPKDMSSSAVPQVKHTQNSAVIPLYEVLEIAFAHESQYEDPFFDVTIDVTLTSPSSTQVQVGGFYYRPGLWKARFAPGELGRWTYRFVFRNARGHTASGDGAFICIKGR